jgi:hypothetical protein
MPRYLSFFTDHTLGNNGFAGRVCGDDIRLGDRFTAEYRVESHINEDEAWSELFFTNPIDMKVVRIEAYNRELPEIASGYTCLLEFEGDTSSIAPRALLGDENTRECHDEELERSRRRNPKSEQGGGGQPATRSESK